MTTSHDFGPQLKAMRERRGITLESITDATKISSSLLEALERGNVSHWPKGIFRRAFFRDYAAAIGAPVEDMLAEFLRLFPEDGQAGPGAHSPGELRLTLATVRAPTRRRVRRIIAGLADAGLVVLLGVAAAWWLAVDRSTAVAVAGLVYYPLTTAWLGRGLLSFRLHDGVTVNRSWRTTPAHTAHAGATLQAAPEPVREEGRAAGFHGDRRTGFDRRRSARLIPEPENNAVAGVFGMRKGSAA